MSLHPLPILWSFGHIAHPCLVILSLLLQVTNTFQCTCYTTTAILTDILMAKLKSTIPQEFSFQVSLLSITMLK